MTTESEMHQMLAQDGVLLLTTRVKDSDTVSLANLALMEEDLARAAATIQPAVPLDVVAYGCTSGAIAIGEDRVAELVASVHATIAVTNQFRSAVTALKSLGATRIALVSPYVASLTSAMRDHLENAGIKVVHAVTFGLELSSEICSVSPDSILAASVEANRENAEAIFICCGGLRTISILDEAERRIGKPVISSNQSLAWHALRLAGIDDHLVGYGRLFGSPLLDSGSGPSRSSGKLPTLGAA
jgi:maleate isomerase